MHAAEQVTCRFVFQAPAAQKSCGGPTEEGCVQCESV